MSTSSTAVKLTRRGRQILRELPARILVFLNALSVYAHLRDALFPRGYTLAVHDHFWKEFLRFAGYLNTATSSAPVASAEVRGSALAVAQWQDSAFRLVRVVLKHDFPEQHAFVLDGLVPIPGLGAVMSVAAPLDRLDALDKDPERKHTRKADHAALAKLADRGITPGARQYMRAQVAGATYTPALDPVAQVTTAAPQAPAGKRPTSEERAEALQAVAALFEEWSEVARLQITNRSDLIRLGLVSRRRSKKRSEIDSETPSIVSQRPALTSVSNAPRLLPRANAASNNGDPNTPKPSAPEETSDP